MKRTPLSVAAISAVAALGALTACSETKSDASPATVTETVTVTATPEAPALPSTPGGPTPSGIPGAPTSPASTESGERSERGNIVKKAGEKAGIKDKAGEEAVAFTVTDIDPDYKCTSRSARKPQNGRFVALTVEVAAGKNLAEVTSSDSLHLVTGWNFQDKDGTVPNANPLSSATFSCLAESDRLASRIGPASKAKGLIVLDLPKSEGIVVYKPSWGYRQQLGWEWEVGGGEGAWTYERDGASKSPLGNA